MATKVFNRGNFMIVQKDSGNESPVPITFFDYYIQGTTISFYDRSEGKSSAIVSDTIANIQDEGGAPVGNEAAVKAYLGTESSLNVTGTTTPAGTQDVDVVANTIGLSTEATLSSVKTNTDGSVLTATLNRRTDATGSPIAAGAKYVSIYNAGIMDATVLGTTLKKGESIDFPTNLNDTLPAISYDATGTELVIQTIV